MILKRQMKTYRSKIGMEVKGNMSVYRIFTDFQQEFSDRLSQADYILADTRIPWVSLYDHLSLTAGIAVTMTKELLSRGRSPNNICGIDLPENELRALACLCGFIHDIGKARMGETKYRNHVQEGIKYAQEWLESKNIKNHLRSVILNAIGRHHLRDGPQTILEQVICLADSYASAGDRPELSKAGNISELVQLTSESLDLEHSLFGGNKPLCFLLGDVDAVKEYVYETNSLPDIRGASEILQYLEDKVRELFQEYLAAESLIYCGGGGFLAIVPASEVEEWKKRIEALYLKETCTATITVVFSKPVGYLDIGRGLMPYDDEQVRKLVGNGVAADLLFSHFEALLQGRVKRKNFGEVVAKLTSQLQQAKRQKEEAPFFETLPIYRRCHSCGKRASAKQDRVKAEWLCDICNEKRHYGREGRRVFTNRFIEWAKTNKDVEIPQKNHEGRLRFPEDLDALAGDEGRIAFLYADGNNMGDLLQLMPSPASYRHFSQVLHSAIGDALFSAFWKVFGEVRLRNSSLPFEIIALGGDDLVAIVPASYGWALAVQVLEEFENNLSVQKLECELNERLKDALLKTAHLSLSAGLAIADVKYPVSFLFDLAEGLLKEAKHLARTVQSGTLCHLWLRAPVTSESVKVLMDELYKREGRYLTARPYTKDQAKELIGIARELSTIATSQRKSLAESVEKGIHVSLNYALYQTARISKDEQEKIIGTFEKLGTFMSKNSKTESLKKFWFWQEDDQDKGWKTALLDALELIELGATKVDYGGKS